ncbi:MAG: pyridoxal phosphate-dependent aminotransferase, partial [Myxococcales bacterium]
MPWPSDENAISRALRDRREPYVDLTESNPTRAGLPPAAQLGALSDPRALRYEPHPKGLLAARE